MSLKQFIYSVLVLVTMLSCQKKSPSDFTSMHPEDKERLTDYYHRMSMTYLQPSEIHRIYKDSALMVTPNHVEYRQRLSYSYKKVGDHIKAMEILNKAVDIDIINSKTDALEYRAWTLLYFYRDYEGTIKDVDLIEKIAGTTYNPCWGEPCGFHKGQALYKLGQFEEAIERFNLVNSDEEKRGFDTIDNYMISFYIGRCYTELKAYDKAIAYYKRTLASVEKLPEAYFQLGLVYKALKDHVKAVENFNLAKKYIAYGLSEPYIERFDKVFLYMIDNELKTLHL